MQFGRGHIGIVMANVVKKITTSKLAFVINPFIWLNAVIVDTIFGKKKQRPGAAEMDLQDRNATITSSEAPHVYIYGRARVGSAIVAALTSGSQDEYKHIVCVHAAHECDAIEEVYINGKALGTLDANGNVTSGDFYTLRSVEATESFTGTGFTLAQTPVGLRIIYPDDEIFGSFIEETSYTLAGKIISGLVVSRAYTCNYSYTVADQYVRIKKHLGVLNDPADADTISEVPAKWTANHKLSGMCYTIVRLDLNFADFQSGVPSIEMLIRGKKLSDVRSASYPNDIKAWSQNPALMIADYLTSEICGVPYTDLPLADFITAANVCDESTAFGSLYKSNGTVTASQGQAGVLEDMARCMAGTIVSTTWGITAGKYVAPVMALSQSDIVGSLSYNAGVPEADLFNGVKGQYISAANNYISTDFAPYQNSAYVTADGSELWTDIDFQFTDEKQRIHNLARIYTEDQRNGFGIKADFSYKCWNLKVGQRVTFTSAFMGQTSKVYRVIDKSYSITSAVQITLKEDAASIWDLSDAVTADSTPNTSLPSPFFVPVPGNLRLISEALYETTGSAGAKVKIIVGWDAPADVNVVQYEIESKGYFTALYANKTISINTQAEILDVGAGKYDFRIRALNHLGLFSAYVSKTVEVFGLTTPPGNVIGFTVVPFNGAAMCRWTRTTDLDVKLGGDVQIRFTSLTAGALWENSVILPDGEYNGDATNAIVSLASGTYLIKFIDSTGHYSVTAASFLVHESLITAFTPVLTSTQHPAFTGAKTDCVATGGLLKLDSVTLIDSMTTLMDAWGYLDSIGGIKSFGTYAFDATMDLGAIATRRFHSHIASLGYNAADLFDDRLDSMDAWADFDGGVINDTTASVYASVSDDNITFKNWTPFKVADFNCRYAKFKCELVSGDPIHNIQISELSVTAKLP